MRNILLVIKHEILSTLGQPSFWLTTFVLPVIIMGFSFGAQFLSTQMLDEEASIITGADSPETQAIGYVDYAGILVALPPGIPEHLVRAYPDEAAASAALQAGELSQYYVIAADFMESGGLAAVDETFSPLGNIATIDLFLHIINYNLLGEEATLAQRVSNPLARVRRQALELPETEESEEITRMIISFGTLFIFFFVLTMSSGFMLQSVSREKENRTVEILLVSLRPRDLMLGKILGLGVVALLQMGIWMGGSLWTLQRGDSLLATFGVVLTSGITLPEGFVIWVALYFLFGYILYASLLGAIGALAPSARETGPFTFIAMFPLMLPLWVNSTFTVAPHGPLATVLSIFPLTSPTSMLPRLAAGGVPLWQPALGLVLLAATTYGFVLLAARFFRADTLLSSDALDWKRLVEAYQHGARNNSSP